MTEIVTVQTVQTVREPRRAGNRTKERLLPPRRELSAGVAAGAAAAQDRPVAAVSTPAHHGNRLLPEDFHVLGGRPVAMPFCGGGLAIDSKKSRSSPTDLVPPTNHGVSVHEPNPEETVLLKKSRWARATTLPTLAVPGPGLSDPLASGRGGLTAAASSMRTTACGSARESSTSILALLEFSLYGKDLTTGQVTTKPCLVAAPGGLRRRLREAQRRQAGQHAAGLRRRYEPRGKAPVAGPTLATADGKILINQKNHGTSEFSRLAEALRPAKNHFRPKDHKNGWMALEPQERRGPLGRPTASTPAPNPRTPRGIRHWPLLGVGDIDYQCRELRPSVPPPKPRPFSMKLHPYKATYDKVELTSGNTGTCRARNGLGWLRSPAGPQHRQSSLSKVDSVIMVFDNGEKASSIRASLQAEQQRSPLPGERRHVPVRIDARSMRHRGTTRSWSHPLGADGHHLELQLYQERRGEQRRESAGDPLAGPGGEVHGESWQPDAGHSPSSRLSHGGLFPSTSPNG